MSQLDVGGEVLRWVTFQLGEETYGINVLQVKEVLRYVEVVPVPGTPKYVMGIINLRGSVVTVIDTRIRFNLEQSNVTDETRIIVVELDDQVIGILVDSVAEVMNLSTSDIDMNPSIGQDENSRFIQGVSNKDDQLFILVDLDKLFSDEELNDMAQL